MVKTLEKVSLILENSRRATKRGRNKKEDDTDEVVLIKKTLSIKGR